ncbi:MAG: flagellar motor switch protein FliN [Thermodesulfobacteriota bacterium]|nr:flagellar motor switch protein FliN [Thermodesulfobacteriota bacterium]
MGENETSLGEEMERDTPEALDTEDDISWEQAGLGSPETAVDEGGEERGIEPTLPKFTDLKKDPKKIRSGNLDLILDVPLNVSVELGRSKMVINDLLQLARGSIIELSKLAEEPLDVLVNGKMIARGEVVVVNDKFGIRLTDVISPSERIQNLG